jgi:hypothetical protein
LQLAPTDKRVILRQAITISRILNEEGSNLAFIREGRLHITTLGNVNTQSRDYWDYLRFIEFWEKLEWRFGTKGKVNL